MSEDTLINVTKNSDKSSDASPIGCTIDVNVDYLQISVVYGRLGKLDVARCRCRSPDLGFTF